MNRRILPFAIVCLMFVLAPSCAHAGTVAAPQASSQPAITNDDVIGMLKAGVAVNSILSTIDHANKKAFDLSKEGRAQLEAAGATSEMIDVMRGRRKLPKSVRESPVQPIPFVAPAAAAATVPVAATAAPASTPAPVSAAPAASSSPAPATATATVKLPLAAIEVKHFTQADGLGLTPEFMSIYHASLLAAMPKMKVAARVVDDGGAISDAEAANAVVAEGRMVGLKKGGMVGKLSLQVSLYRRSDHALVKAFATEVPFKISPLTKDKHIADITGGNTATEIQRALKKG